MTTTTTRSVCEMVKDWLIDNADVDVIPNVVVGPAADEQQEQGVVSVVDAGWAKVEPLGPLEWPRVQLRCVGRSLDHAEQMANTVKDLLHARGRTVLHQASSDVDYLAHQFVVTVGPSAHYDSADTWEYLLFVEVTLGVDPIS